MKSRRGPDPRPRNDLKGWSVLATGHRGTSSRPTMYSREVFGIATRDPLHNIPGFPRVLALVGLGERLAYAFCMY